MVQSDKIDVLLKNLYKALSEMPVTVQANRENLFFKSRYADFGAVMQASKKVLSNNGLAITQFVVSDYQSDRNLVGVRTRLFHGESGQWLEETVYIPLPKYNETEDESSSNKNSNKKAKPNLPQLGGVVIQYYKRYSWMAICNLYSGDEDNDGNILSDEEIKRVAMVEELKQKISEKKSKFAPEIKEIISSYSNDGGSSPTIDELPLDVMSEIIEKIKSLKKEKE